MKGTHLISVCIAALLLAATAPAVIPTGDVAAKIFTGPKVVFDLKDAAPHDVFANGNAAKGKPPVPPAVDKWAVIIGISDYQGIGNDLLYPDDDARDMYNYLIAKGYPSKNIKMLLNTKASANSIISAIDWMNSMETKTTSECVFFYSGHGTTYDGYNDGDNEYTDEGIVSTNLYLILDGQLRQKFSNFTSQKILIVFDSCFSGGMNDLAASGRVVDTACGEFEYSWDGSSAMSNGVYTYYYMQGLATYNGAETAHAYAAPLARNAVQALYGETMTPQEFDSYTGTWLF